MPSLTNVQKLQQDTEVMQRMISAAILAEIPDPEQWVAQHRADLIVAKVNDGNDTLASVYDYMMGQINQAQATIDSARGTIITDEHLIHAVNAVRTQENDA